MRDAMFVACLQKILAKEVLEPITPYGTAILRKKDVTMVEISGVDDDLRPRGGPGRTGRRRAKQKSPSPQGLFAIGRDDLSGVTTMRIFSTCRWAARGAMTLADGPTFVAFERNRMAQLASLKAVEIVGEAASHVSADIKTAHPEIQWSGIVGMQHRLVH